MSTRISFAVKNSLYNRLHASNIYYYDFRPKSLEIHQLKLHAFSQGIFTSPPDTQLPSMALTSFKKKSKDTTLDEYTAKFIKRHKGKTYKNKSCFIGMLRYSFIDFDHMEQKGQNEEGLSAATMAKLIPNHIAIFPSLSEQDAEPQNCYSYRMIIDRGYALLPQYIAHILAQQDPKKDIHYAIAQPMGDMTPVIWKDNTPSQLKDHYLTKPLRHLSLYDAAKAVLSYEAELIDNMAGTAACDRNAARPIMHSKHTIGSGRTESFTLLGTGQPLYQILEEAPHE